MHSIFSLGSFELFLICVISKPVVLSPTVSAHQVYIFFYRKSFWFKLSSFRKGLVSLGIMLFSTFINYLKYALIIFNFGKSARTLGNIYVCKLYGNK